MSKSFNCCFEGLEGIKAKKDILKIVKKWVDNVEKLKKEKLTDIHETYTFPYESFIESISKNINMLDNFLAGYFRENLKVANTVGLPLFRLTKKTRDIINEAWTFDYTTKSEISYIDTKRIIDKLEDNLTDIYQIINLHF